MLFMYGSWDDCWKQGIFYRIGEEFGCLNVDVLRACARLWKLVIRRNAEEIVSGDGVDGYFLPMSHDSIEREIRFPGLLEALKHFRCPWFTIKDDGIVFRSGAPVVIRHGGGWMTKFRRKKQRAAYGNFLRLNWRGAGCRKVRIQRGAV